MKEIKSTIKKRAEGAKEQLLSMAPKGLGEDLEHLLEKISSDKDQIRKKISELTSIEKEVIIHKALEIEAVRKILTGAEEVRQRIEGRFEEKRDQVEQIISQLSKVKTKARSVFDSRTTKVDENNVEPKKAKKKKVAKKVASKKKSAKKKANPTAKKTKKVDKKKIKKSSTKKRSTIKK